MKFTEEQIGGYPHLPFVKQFRGMAIPIAKVLVKTPITPNQITFFCVLLALVRIPLFISGNPYLIFVGALTMLLDKILDNTDGIVARYKKKFSLRGIFLDKFHHDIHYIGLFVGLGIGTFISTGYITYLFCGIIAMVFYILTRNVFHYHKMVVGDKKTLNPFSEEKMNILRQIKELIDIPRMYGDMIVYPLAFINIFYPVFGFYLIYYAFYNLIYFIPNFYYATIFKEVI